MPSGTGKAACASMSAYSANAPGPPAGEPSTRCPVPTISPVSSTPGVYGRGGFSWYMPIAMSTSGKFSAAARTSTSTWPSPGVGWSTSSRLMTSEGSPRLWTRHARIPATLPDAWSGHLSGARAERARRGGKGGPFSVHAGRAQRLGDDGGLAGRRLCRRHPLEPVRHRAHPRLDDVGGARLAGLPGHDHRVGDLGGREHRKVRGGE